MSEAGEEDDNGDDEGGDGGGGSTEEEAIRALQTAASYAENAQLPAEMARAQISLGSCV